MTLPTFPISVSSSRIFHFKIIRSCRVEELDRLFFVVFLDGPHRFGLLNSAQKKPDLERTGEFLHFLLR